MKGSSPPTRRPPRARNGSGATREGSGGAPEGSGATGDRSGSRREEAGATRERSGPRREEAGGRNGGPRARAGARRGERTAGGPRESARALPSNGDGRTHRSSNGGSRNGGSAAAAIRRGSPERRPRLKKLRLTLIFAGLSLLAAVSLAFGMMMAVARELPSLESTSEYQAARNSVLIADDPGGTQVAKLTGQRNRILVREGEISPNLRNAVVAMEDRRFYEHEGVDYRGIARALWNDLLEKRAVQGGSTVTQQFVKNALGAQGDRTVFQKLREAALAYHLERLWSKPKILTQYLNSVYFGNGAYGVESAVRTYFGKRRANHDPDAHAAREVAPHEAALLTAMIASPSRFDPIQRPEATKARRDLVLKAMLDQEMLEPGQYETALTQALPSADEVEPPRPDSDTPHFSTWITQQLVERYGSGAVFGGGLKIKTTLDPALQQRAEQAIAGRLQGVGPSASLVAIENRTGEVKAMVGGSDYADRPFNLATNAHRQPGSAFKPFTLIAALQQGYGPGSTFSSRKKVLQVKGSEPFEVNNYEDRYSGTASLAQAISQSDNSVFAELGIELGTGRIAQLAERMGIETDVSTNPAMTLGGLETGVSPLEMAYAYSTIANEGRRIGGTLGTRGGPIAIERVEQGGRTLDENERSTTRVYEQSVGREARRLLGGVVSGGTGTAAALDEFAGGKTGTTDSYGDAWFVGFNKDWTVAVWVGYPDELKYMRTEYRGEPVAGGTYPAEIWGDFLSAAIELRDSRRSERDEDDPASARPDASPAPKPSAPRSTPSPDEGTPTPSAPSPAPSTPRAPERSAPRSAPRSTPPAGGGGPRRTPGGGGGGSGGGGRGGSGGGGNRGDGGGSAPSGGTSGGGVRSRAKEAG